MRRFISVLFILLRTLSIYGFLPIQQTQANITITNRNHQTVTQMTDGDTIQIQIKLPQPVTQRETIHFKFAENSFAVGNCVITSGNTGCATDPFPSLGWHWDPNGVAQNKRVIEAVDENGNPLGQSNPITVAPRPVIMVHGFLSSWQTWKPYLDSNGYLASLGLQGFAWHLSIIHREALQSERGKITVCIEIRFPCLPAREKAMYHDDGTRGDRNGIGLSERIAIRERQDNRLNRDTVSMFAS